MSQKKRPVTKVCPDCGEPTFPTSFGFPTKENPDVIEMGCLIEVPSPDRGCKACGWLGDYFDVDGSPVEVDYIKEDDLKGEED